jgi:hypothetical protein
MKELTVKTNTTGTTIVLGAWELRAGSMDTTEHLSRGSTYPGNIEAFKPLQTDAANGYDPAPKLALLQMTSASGGNSVIAVTEGGDMNAVLSVSVSQKSGTASTAVPTLLHAVSGGEATLTLTTVGVSDVGVYDVMVLYN